MFLGGEGDTLLTILLVWGAVALIAFSLALIVWTFRDMRSRSRDGLALLGVTVLVAVLNVPGLIIYFFLRPRETLSEAYERSLEEEALLQAIEDKPTCPGCRQRVEADWQICPHCQTRLKKPCVRCGKLLDMAWELCPYCAATQPAAMTIDPGMGVYAPPRPAVIETPRESRRRASARAEQAQPRDASLEFVDSD